MSRTSKGWFIIVGAATGFALAAVGLFCWQFYASLQSKQEWGVLWSVESRYQSQPVSAVEFLVSGQRHLVCVRGASGKRVWIMLDPKYAPFYKQRDPDEPFEVSQEDFVHILQSTSVDATVRECLRSHVARHTN